MIALILAGVANVACAIGCAMYVVLRRRRIRRAKERFGAAAERAAQKKHSIDIEMTKHPSAAIGASHVVQPFQSLLSQPPSAAIAEAPLPSRRAPRPVDEPPAGTGTKDETSFEGVLYAFEGQGASRSIGGATPVVMPPLDEDFIGSVLPEADVANLSAEFEAELYA
jgi:hypothetical protein